MRRRKKKKVFNYKKTRLVWVITGIVVAVSIFFTIQNSTSGARLSQLESIEAKTKQENLQIKSEIIILSSLSNFQEEASELGFFKPQQIVYIAEDVFVAKAR